MLQIAFCFFMDYFILVFPLWRFNLVQKLHNYLWNASSVPSTVLGTAGNGKITETWSGLLSSSSSDHRRDRDWCKKRDRPAVQVTAGGGKTRCKGSLVNSSAQMLFFKGNSISTVNTSDKSNLSCLTSLPSADLWGSRWDFLEGANSFLRLYVGGIGHLHSFNPHPCLRLVGREGENSTGDRRPGSIWLNCLDSNPDFTTQ